MSDPHMPACIPGSHRPEALFKGAPEGPCVPGCADQKVSREVSWFFKCWLVPNREAFRSRRGVRGRSRGTLEPPCSLLVLSHAPVSHVSSPPCFCARAKAASSSTIAVGLCARMVHIGRARLCWLRPPSLGAHGRTRACQITPRARVRRRGGIVATYAAGVGRMPHISASIRIPGVLGGQLFHALVCFVIMLRHVASCSVSGQVIRPAWRRNNLSASSA